MALFTTELNSLASAAQVISASVSTTDTMMDVIFSGASQTTTRTAGAYMGVYVLPSLCGVFCYGSPSVDPPVNTFASALPLDAATTARVVTGTKIPLPNCPFEILLENQSSGSLAAMGNTFSYATYTAQLV